MLAKIDKKEAIDILLNEKECKKVFFKNMMGSEYLRASDYAWKFISDGNALYFNEAEFYKEIEEEA